MALTPTSIKPLEGKSIDLGTFGGVAYYTVKSDGYHLVVTLTPRGAETPVRFVATLAPGQSVTLSTPRKLGEPAIEVSFSHQSEGLFVGVPELVRLRTEPICCVSLQGEVAMNQEDLLFPILVAILGNALHNWL